MKATCVLSARDGDHDGHSTELCDAAPGDDCDNGYAATHPGAKEVCDGRDNDCDGRYDLVDDHPLSGEAIELRAGVDQISPGLGWSSELERLGIAFSDDNVSTFMLASASGAPLESVEREQYIGPQGYDVAAGPTSFGWSEGGQLHYVSVAGNTPSIADSRQTGQHGRAAWNAEMSLWVYAWYNVGTVRVSPGHSVPSAYVGYGTKAIVMKNGLLHFLRTEPSYGDPIFGSVALDATTPKEVALGIPLRGSDPELFSTDNGFAAFWKINDTELVMMEFDDSGNTHRGPVTIPSLAHGNTAYDGKSFVHAAEGNGNLKITRILPDCNVTGETVTVPLAGRVPVAGVDVTATDEGFAMTWIDCGNSSCTPFVNAPSLKLRLMGEHLCE